MEHLIEPNRTMSLRIGVTSSCNQSCCFCFRECNPSTSCELPIETALAASLCAKETGIDRVKITGGEPLMYSRLVELIKLLKSNGINIGLTTNGSLLNEYAQDLITAGLNSINISLVSLQEAKFAKITGTNHLKDTLDAISTLSKINSLELKLNVPIISENVDEIDDFLSLAMDYTNLRVRFFSILSYYPNDKFTPVETSLILETMLEKREKLALKQLSERVTIRPQRDRLSFICKKCLYYSVCTEHAVSLRLTPDAMLKPCVLNTSLSRSFHTHDHRIFNEVYKLAKNIYGRTQ